MEKDYKNKLELIIIIIVSIFTIGVIQTQKGKEVQLTSASTATNNTKICWGIKRNAEHLQPDVGAANRKTLEEKNGICLGNKDEKIIYLTFDNGYEAGYTNQILDTLKANEVKATFFITAHYLNTASEIVERMIKEGHIVGNHISVNSMYHQEKSYES